MTVQQGLRLLWPVVGRGNENQELAHLVRGPQLLARDVTVQLCDHWAWAASGGGRLEWGLKG